MEIKKLKDMLRNAAGGPVGIQMCQEAADTLEQLQAENERLKAQVPRWIPVEERLPEESDGMVLFTNGKAVTSGYRNHMFRMSGEEGIYAPAIRKGGDYMRVTHWMPLPKAPKEGKKR